MNALSPDDMIELTSFGSAIDILRTHTDGSETLGMDIITATSGASVVVRTANSGSTNRTLTVVQGDRIEGKFRSIQSVTNVTKIRLYW
jgi:hypothetical protein